MERSIKGWPLTKETKRHWVKLCGMSSPAGFTSWGSEHEAPPVIRAAKATHFDGYPPTVRAAWISTQVFLCEGGNVSRAQTVSMCNSLYAQPLVGS